MEFTFYLVYNQQGVKLFTLLLTEQDSKYVCKSHLKNLIINHAYTCHFVRVNNDIRSWFQIPVFY